jgi:hypothetical protein
MHKAEKFKMTREKLGEGHIHTHIIVVVVKVGGILL